MSSCVFLFISTLLLFTSTSVTARIRYIDLSYTYDNKTLTWPSEQKERFRFTTQVRFDSPHYEANSFETAEHLGTHIDAPRHFVAGKYGVAEISLNDLIGPSVVVNVTEKADTNADLLINVADFEIHERKFGRIPDRSIVLLYSGTIRRSLDKYFKLDFINLLKVLGFRAMIHVLLWTVSGGTRTNAFIAIIFASRLISTLS